MSANHQTLDHLRIRARGAPLCYSRHAPSDTIDQERINARSSAAVMMLSVMTCAAAFVIAYGGWWLMMG